MKGVTCSNISFRVRLQFQSTHPVKGVTLTESVVRLVEPISIHTPREGCDEVPITETYYDDISIHTPREGCDCKTDKYSLVFLPYL